MISTYKLSLRYFVRIKSCTDAKSVGVSFLPFQEAFMIQKERELKESVRRDRDNEIEAAILRLEDDMQQQRDELEKTTENR